MQLDVSLQQYIVTSGVCLLVSLLVAESGCLGSGRKLALQNPGWKSGNGSAGQNISPGCGCVCVCGTLLLLVHVHVNVYVHQAARRHSTQPI